MMSKTGAKRQASAESGMYRQGSGWIVSTYDPQVGCYREGEELPYFSARQVLKDWRTDRVSELLGAEC